MAKPIATVQLGVARLGIEISDCTSDAEIAAWVRSFHRALALQKPELNAYAAELLAEVDAYRAAEADRKARRHSPEDSSGKPRKSADSLHQSASQLSSQPVTYPPRVQALLGRYPTTRPRPENEGGAVEVLWTEQDEAALAVAVENDPSYPWEAAVETERKAGKGIRGLSTFIAKRPAPTPRLKSLQARLEAPSPVAAPAPEAPEHGTWEKQERFDHLTRLSMLPGFKPELREELDQLTVECREHFQIDTRRLA